MEKLLWEYKALEKYAHISFDDIMQKISQEVAELVEAKYLENEDEIQKEAKDVLINLFSISQELNILQNDYSPLQVEWIQLVIAHWKWNSQVNAYRNRYSKTPQTLDEVSISTKNLVNSVLSFLPENMSMDEIVQSSFDKMKLRKDLYKPQINLEDFVTWYKDFPKKWIHFRDVSPLLQNPEALKYAIFELANACQNADVIAWLDARGFIFGSLVAQLLQKPFVMIRKSWKLPWEKLKISYWLEYGKDEIEIQKESIQPWQKVALIDDLLATWWTIQAWIDLVEKLWWIIEVLWFVISLEDEFLIHGEIRKQLQKYPIKSLLTYQN